VLNPHFWLGGGLQSHLATVKMHVSWQIDSISFPVLQSLRNFMVHHSDIPVLNHKAQKMRGIFIIKTKKKVPILMYITLTCLVTNML
jgi:hypothetical protein